MSQSTGLSISLEEEPLLQGKGLVTPDGFYDLLWGLMSRLWSGTIVTEIHGFQKKIILCNGTPVFARSNLIDDRLGEVIYRKGMIHMDQLLESATQVTRDLRFGQVLLSSQIFDQKTLWKALQEQVTSIYTSIFMADTITYELHPLQSYEFHLGFDHPKKLIKTCFAYGLLYRNFIKKVDIISNPPLSLTQLGQILVQTEKSSYLGDLLTMIQNSSLLSAFLESSKLHISHTMSGLMDLYKKGYVAIGTLQETTESELQTYKNLSAIRDGYHVLVKKTFALYKQTQGTFPLEALKAMASDLDPYQTFGIILDKEGLIGPQGAEDMAIVINSQVFTEAEISEKIALLIRYLIQMAGDSLPKRFLDPVNQDYKKIFETLRLKHHTYES